MLKLEEICPYKVRVHYPPNAVKREAIVVRRNRRAMVFCLDRILEIYPTATWEVLEWPKGDIGGGQ